jgi:spoIIIJ-associated protein
MQTNRSNQPIRIEAKSVEQAITLACVKLNVAKEALDYKVLKEPKAGLVSFFMGAKAEIEAWPRTNSGRGGRQDRGDRKGAHSGQRDAARAAEGETNRDGGRGHNRGARDDRRHQAKGGGRDRPRREERTPREERAPAEPLSPEVQAQLEKDICQFCKEICERVVGESVAVSYAMTDGKLKLEIDNAAVAEIIQTNTKFVESLEHILRKRPRHLKQELPFRIFIDSQGSRKGREEELARMAKEKAEEVVATGQKCVLDFKSAADRKIIHMALENDSRIYTKSIGNGPSRKLMILLSRGRRNDQSNDQVNDQDNESNTGSNS